MELNWRHGLDESRLREALLVVRDMLASGALPWHAKPGLVGADRFNMEQVLDVSPRCGAIGCIGGYMAWVLGADPEDAAMFVLDAPKRWHQLFAPRGDEHCWPDWAAITPTDAVIAIDEWLAGRPPWSWEVYDPDSEFAELEEMGL